MLALIMFYETRGYNPEKAFRVLIWVVYSLIENYFRIYYLDFLSKDISEIAVGSRGNSKYGDKYFNIILGIGIPYFLMNLISCR